MQSDPELQSQSFLSFFTPEFPAILTSSGLCDQNSNLPPIIQFFPIQ